MQANADTTHTNALIHETSPYLLQHAHNPVTWYAWGDEALNLAKHLNKPILLSIGYSACHWCHVMAHESFENPDIAAVMNELFINIKVDREERPDLDKIYQIAHQMLTQRSGGWPLTMFLDPHSHYPFFGGTYFPPQPRYGMIGFPELLRRVAAFYEQHQAEIQTQREAIAEALHRYENIIPSQQSIEMNVDPLNLARDQIIQNFDTHHGGFSQAPKFPHLTHIERLLHHYVTLEREQNEQDDEALNAALLTLTQMAKGGIYDQLGGGFYRYSVDDQWIIPHFEKMLYDNAPFISIYSEAYQLTENPLFKQIAIETAEWVLREMQSPEGGFYSTLDADSEGHEGKFYVWTPDEVKAHLDTDLYKLFAAVYGFDRHPNFEETHWHLHTFKEPEKVAHKFGITLAELEQKLDAAKQLLFTARSKRIRPNRDEKILTSWNGLLLKGLATAGRIFQEPRYIHAAEKILTFIQEKLWIDGRLMATYTPNQARFNGYLDDYAFVLDGILSLLQARWSTENLHFAQALLEILLTQFEDTTNGGFFFTAHDHEKLITRTKPLLDDATPSGNGIAAYVLGRFGYLLAEPRYLTATERTLRVAWAGINQIPFAHNTLLLALEDYLFSPEIIVLRGAAGTELNTWQTAIQKTYRPQSLCFAIPTETTNLPEKLNSYTAQTAPIAYRCRGLQCDAPITTLAALVK